MRWTSLVLIFSSWLIGTASAQDLEPITVELALVCSTPNPECRPVPTLNGEDLLVEDTAELTLEDIEQASVRLENLSPESETATPRMPGQPRRTPNLQPHLTLHFTEKGKKALAELTEANKGEKLAVVVDGKVMTALKIHAAFLSGTIVLSDLSEIDAERMLSRINAQLQYR